MSLKQKKRKFKPRIKLNQNIYITAEPLHWNNSIQGTPSGDTSLGLEGVP